MSFLDMIRKITLNGGTIRTKMALEWSLSSVGSDVPLKVTVEEETLGTVLTTQMLSRAGVRVTSSPLTV